MPILLDRFTASNSPVIPGQINVNTAAPTVLRTIPGLMEEEVQAIVSRRGQLDGEEKLTPGWLVTTGVVSPEVFAVISNDLTTRSQQFTIESIGFADHVGAFRRLQAVVEMRGQLAQVKYLRDISTLGIGYPVHDDERSEGFAFSR